MSNIRREFYEAVNKANVQKPKKVIKKFSPKEELTLEKQIQNILDMLSRERERSKQLEWRNGDLNKELRALRLKLKE